LNILNVMLLLMLLFATTTSVVALGLRLSESMPVKYFTAEDWAQAKQTVTKALELGKLSETFTWHNQSTGHNGSYRVLKILEEDGKPCRDLLVRHEAGQARGGGNYRFCRMADDEWKTLGRVPVEAESVYQNPTEQPRK
jgi:surface antigen